MQYSVAALRALLLGLAGSCQVAAFGTMPDLSAFKDAKISTKGESADDVDTLPLKLDENFCTNAISKFNIGSRYCYEINDLGPGACGGGADTYRRGDHDPNKYDVCQWRDGSCKAAMYTYECGSICFPTAESIVESTNDVLCADDK